MDNLINSINLLSKLEIVKENEEIYKKILSLKERAEKNEIQIVVLGQFKRGKSSLINALMGSSILPTSVIPLTSIVTVIKYGKETKIWVIFLNGNKTKIEIKDLEEYVTENKNPENKKGVEKVEIEYPSDFLKNGVQIIDTPGVGSVYKHNTDVAYEFVPKADAGIFVVTADPPISQAELQFLLSIKDYLGKIFFVQNKIDQVPQKDRNVSLEFTKSIIEKTLNVRGVRFSQLSSRLGLEGKLNNDIAKLNDSNLPDFENQLNSFLVKEKNKVIEESIGRKLSFLINEIELILNLRKQTITTPLYLLKEKIEAFEKEIQNIKLQKEDADYILEGQAQKLVNQNLTEDIEALKAKKLPELLDKLEEFYEENKRLGSKELSENLNKFLETEIKTIFSDWRKEEEIKLQKSLKSILERFSEETNKCISKVIELSSNIFDVKIEHFEIQHNLIEEIEFKFSFDEIPTDIEIFTPVVSRLPKFISGKLLYNNIKHRAVEEFDKHCGRSRFDFSERLIKSIYDYRNKLNDALENIIKEIENAIKQGMEEKSKKIKDEKEALSWIQAQEENIITVKNHTSILSFATD